ncbi:hypothetical protein [Sphingomonas sp. Leaf10]|uniref:hypothetical protein n=1 Tax=Sphingomonas sp. Leaf10 TaxID=1735676 RepID=UPI00070164FB|nr:hypothetical protein [Sphingomonas sp. Leaf10]KQM37965.1 hypothetical protein ASE59_11745 [Sphingomonas sp. Leaf10]
MDPFLIVALVACAELLGFQIMCDTAPEGYQDDAGFHLGTPVSRNSRNIHGDRGTVPGVQHHGA